MWPIGSDTAVVGNCCEDGEGEIETGGETEGAGAGEGGGEGGRMVVGG